MHMLLCAVIVMCCALAACVTLVMCHTPSCLPAALSFASSKVERRSGPRRDAGPIRPFHMHMRRHTTLERNGRKVAAWKLIRPDQRPDQRFLCTPPRPIHR
eukprot:COSAG01_NODE_1347_length_10632_cov_29.175370_2_plen_101_part_00